MALIDERVTPETSPSTASSLVDVLRWRAAVQGNKRAYTFLVDGENDEAHMTYAELDRRARALAATLRSYGAAGERVLLLYPPGLEYVAGFLACLYAGAIAVPAYPPDPSRLNRTLPRLQAMVADAEATIALTTSQIMMMAQFLFQQAPDLAQLRWLATDEIKDKEAANWREPQIGRDTLAFLQYTSGSTRAPRGVMLTHSNLLHNSSVIQDAFEVNENTVGVIWLPPYHDMGLIGGVLQPAFGGSTCILMSPLSFLQRPMRWLEAVSRYGGTISGGPNFAYDLCVRKVKPEHLETLDLSQWSVAFNGAEPIRPETLHLFAETFAPCGFNKDAFYPCYGLAEATLIVSGGEKSDPPVYFTVDKPALERDRVVPADADAANAQTLVGCGTTMPDQQIVIVDPDTLARCPDGQVGEIWVTGPSVAGGYWKQPEENKRTFGARVAGTEQGSFLRTGDLGFLRNGELFVGGRLKDLIIIDGLNHYPQDIELTVENCHAAVRPGCSAAFAVDINNQERLVVVTEVAGRPGANGKDGLDTKAIGNTIRRAIATNHDLRVHDVVLLKARSIPKTSSGKIQRHACKADYLAGTLDVLEG